MRLALARALFCEPDLLLLDEPSNMLDVPSITFLANYLQGYPSTVLVVSHDRAFLNEVATDIIHQHSERLDYYKGGNFDSFYATKEERRKTAAREYEKQMGERAHLQAFIDKFRYNAAKSSEAQSRIKKLERMPVLPPPEAEYTVHFKFPDVEKMSPPIIQMTGVNFGYTKDNILLRDVDLDVQLDSRIGIVGPNGAGKTTALKLLIGALSPTTGLISQNPRLRVGYFAQHHVDALDLNDSAVGFMSKKYHGRADEEYRRHLGAFGITGMTGLQKMELLSGGQKSRVAFAILALQNPHILVLDEPSNHLDIEAMDALSDALRKFQGGVLIVSHDVSSISPKFVTCIEANMECRSRCWIRCARACGSAMKARLSTLRVTSRRTRSGSRRMRTKRALRNIRRRAVESRASAIPSLQARGSVKKPMIGCDCGGCCDDGCDDAGWAFPFAEWEGALGQPGCDVPSRPPTSPHHNHAANSRHQQTIAFHRSAALS
jgi:ATPase subunit of ABC transporter with duplicated ATPase domains